ncbi:MAG: BBP7 family outer membrane beta-barrel protein [Planctomycetota bacterium]
MSVTSVKPEALSGARVRAATLAAALASALVPGVAPAQDTPPLPTLAPQGVEIVTPPAGTPASVLNGPATPQPAAGGGMAAPDATPLMGDGAMAGGYDMAGVEYGSAGSQLLDSCPPLTESTGTWLNRGFWYSQVEAVVLQREWNRRDLILAGDVNSFRTIRLGRTDPGREGSLRLTLGRFLFRDAGNRDHNFEMTFMGGGEFGQDQRLIADAVGGLGVLVVPSDIDLASGFSYDGAQEMVVRYDSRFNSVEANYTGSSRLRRDRMELMPDGQWVRRANAGLTYQWLAGLRYFDLTENVNWQAFGINNDFDSDGITDPEDFDGENGQYLLRTSNDLFGLQLGGGATYQADRFSISVFNKLGFLANDVKSTATLTYDDAATGVLPVDESGATAGFSDRNRTDTISFLTEFSVVGRYYLRPNISLRAGYHLMYLTEVGLAPHQIDFDPRDGEVATSGDSFYHGLTTGLDFYW